jgi:hypothetical protein
MFVIIHSSDLACTTHKIRTGTDDHEVRNKEELEELAGL